MGQACADPVGMLYHLIDGVLGSFSLVRVSKDAFDVLGVDADVDPDDLLRVVHQLSVIAAVDVGRLAGDANAVAGGQHVAVVDERAAASLVVVFVVLLQKTSG